MSFFVVLSFENFAAKDLKQRMFIFTKPLKILNHSLNYQLKSKKRVKIYFCDVISSQFVKQKKLLSLRKSALFVRNV